MSIIKKRFKHILIIEVISVIFCISLVAKQGKSNSQYTINTPVDYQETELSKSIVRGEEIYTDFCMQCHLPNGKGTPKIFPPLAGSDWLVNKRKESIHSIKYGLNGPIKVNNQLYNSAMTPLGLEDEEIADVMNYIMNSWGNKQEKMVTTEEVKSIQK
ncbi:c-type cytochrome [Aquimarina sp. 2201CG14-23]|uniref:c-type cytochrome n=1 Tax=Aquimarina mycalae TaxID=3040073 RepID=UPI0024780F74|nr:cytochrome c [Aquimarina sp. 2201CG14-23]MDH7444235.1 cytochrome c [Aquimarina sp. 2201CG14-23]